MYIDFCRIQKQKYCCPQLNRSDSLRDQSSSLSNRYITFWKLRACLLTQEEAVINIFINISKQRNESTYHSKYTPIIDITKYIYFDSIPL